MIISNSYALVRDSGRPCRHFNRFYGFQVVTGQETDLQLVVPRVVEVGNAGGFFAKHELASLPVVESQPEFSFTEIP